MPELHRLLTILLSPTIVLSLILPQAPAMADRGRLQPQWSWGDISKIFKRPKPPSGRRGGDFCILTPFSGPQQTTLLWNDRPLIIWQGRFNQVDLLAASETQSQWQRYLPLPEAKTVTLVQYTGPALQPGQVYQLKFRSLVSPDIVNREVMLLSPEWRDRIRQDLDQLEAQLRLQNANSETIARQKATYFLQRHLLSDALQEMFSIEKPSLELRQAIEQIRKERCQS